MTKVANRHTHNKASAICPKIRLPLNATVKRALSSEAYNNTLQLGLSQLDFLYTYVFRYPRLFAVDIAGIQNTQGLVIDYTVAHSAGGATITALFLAIALANVIHDYSAKKKQNNEKDGQYRKTYSRFEASIRNELEKEANQISIEKINADLNKVLADASLAASLQGKYQSIEITADGYVELVKKVKPVEQQSTLDKIRTIATASWRTLSLTAFAHWIVWIGVGVLSGNFVPFGMGSAGMAGFITPLVAGLLYPVIKIANWLRNHYGKKREIKAETTYEIERATQKKLEAAADFSKLLKQVIYANEKNRLERELAVLERELAASNNAGNVIELDNQAAGEEKSDILSSDIKILKLGKQQWQKTAMTFLGVSVASYTMSQYIAWVLRDVLQVVFNISLQAAGFALGFGIAMMVGSAVYGLWKAYQKYKEVKTYKAEIAKISNELKQKQTSLEAAYEGKLKQIAELRTDIVSIRPLSLAWLDNQLELFESSKIEVTKYPANKPKTGWDRFKKVASLAYTMLNGATTGVMIARIATVAGSAVFLPFTAAALAAPYTIAIVVACGLVYGLFKAYQYQQEKKEARAKDLFEKRQEKVASLKQQLDLADMQIKVLKTKLAVLHQVAARDDSSLLLEAEKQAMLSQKDGRVAEPEPLLIRGVLSNGSIFKPSQRSLEEGDRPRGDFVPAPLKRARSDSHLLKNLSMFEEKPASVEEYHEQALARGAARQ